MGMESTTSEQGSSDLPLCRQGIHSTHPTDMREGQRTSCWDWDHGGGVHPNVPRASGMAFNPGTQVPQAFSPLPSEPHCSLPPPRGPARGRHWPGIPEGSVTILWLSKPKSLFC